MGEHFWNKNKLLPQCNYKNQHQKLCWAKIVFPNFREIEKGVEIVFSKSSRLNGSLWMLRGFQVMFVLENTPKAIIVMTSKYIITSKYMITSAWTFSVVAIKDNWSLLGAVILKIMENDSVFALRQFL